MENEDCLLTWPIPIKMPYVAIFSNNRFRLVLHMADYFILAKTKLNFAFAYWFNSIQIKTNIFLKKLTEYLLRYVSMIRNSWYKISILWKVEFSGNHTYHASRSQTFLRLRNTTKITVDTMTTTTADTAIPTLSAVDKKVAVSFFCFIEIVSFGTKTKTTSCMHSLKGWCSSIKTWHRQYFIFFLPLFESSNAPAYSISAANHLTIGPAQRKIFWIWTKTKL